MELELYEYNDTDAVNAIKHYPVYTQQEFIVANGTQELYKRSLRFSTFIKSINHVKTKSLKF